MIRINIFLSVLSVGSFDDFHFAAPKFFTAAEFSSGASGARKMNASPTTTR